MERHAYLFHNLPEPTAPPTRTRKTRPLSSTCVVIVQRSLNEAAAKAF